MITKPNPKDIADNGPRLKRCLRLVVYKLRGKGGPIASLNLKLQGTPFNLGQEGESEDLRTQGNR